VINKIGRLSTTEDSLGTLAFWNKEIAITEKFFSELIHYQSSFLLDKIHLPENEDYKLLIPDYEKYFNYTIDITVCKKEIVGDKQVLFCMLEHYGTYDPNIVF